MKEINITVKDKIATQTNREIYICGNSDFIVNFDFDAEWSAYDIKTARFVYNNTFTDVVFSGNQCAMPVISGAYNIQCGVFAGDLCTTTSAWISAKRSILCADGSPAAPSEDVYAQIMELINSMEKPIAEDVFAAFALDDENADNVQQALDLIATWIEAMPSTTELPEYSAADAGKVLLVDADGTLCWGKIAAEIIPEPVLAPQDTWYKGTTAKSAITEIELVDTYTATGNEDESWDASEAQDGRIMAYVEGTKLTLAGNGYGCIFANKNSKLAFYSAVKGNYFASLKRIANSNMLNTRYVTNMSYMFFACNALATLDVSKWDTSSVADMGYMFGNCFALTALDVSEWDTSAATSMIAMFYNCNSLTALDTSEWDTSSVADMSYLFFGCSTLATLDVSGWDTSSAVTMSGMFYDCATLATLDVSKWDTSSVNDMSGVFFGCSTLATLDVSGWDTSSANYMTRMFSGCTGIDSLDVSSWNTGNVSKMKLMFSNCTSLSSLDVSGWNVSNVTTMESMFSSCSALTELDVSSWDTSSVADMSGVFSGCTSLSSLDVSGWNVSNVTTMESMFSSNSSFGQVKHALTSLDVRNWDTGSCTDMSFMFYGMNGLTELDVTGWDVSKVTNFDHMTAHGYFTLKGVETWKVSAACENMNAMFHCCQNETFDVSNFDTSSVKYFCQTFENCSKLTSIVGLDMWDTSAGLGFDEMFQNCNALVDLDLSNFDTTNAQDGVKASTNGHTTKTLYNVFNKMYKLKEITLGENFSFSGDGSTTVESYHAVLPTPSETYITGATGLWYSTAYPDGQTPAEVAQTHSGERTYYALAADVVA